MRLRSYFITYHNKMKATLKLHRKKFCSANCNKCPALLKKAKDRVGDAGDALDLCHNQLASQLG